MSTLFTTSLLGGAVYRRIRGGNVPGPYAVLQGTNGNITQAIGCIITAVQTSVQERIQETPTLSQDFFIYSLGRNPYTIIISGYCFPLFCDIRGVDGRAEIIKFYENNKLSNAGHPIRALLANLPFNAWLIGMSADARQDDDMALYSYTITLHALPEHAVNNANKASDNKQKNTGNDKPPQDGVDLNSQQTTNTTDSRGAQDGADVNTSPDAGPQDGADVHANSPPSNTDFGSIDPNAAINELIPKIYN